METAIFGKTGLKVSRLGLGLSEIGHILSMSDIDQAGKVINTALDGGINFLDLVLIASLDFDAPEIDGGG